MAGKLFFCDFRNGHFPIQKSSFRENINRNMAFMSLGVDEKRPLRPLGLLRMFWIMASLVAVDLRAYLKTIINLSSGLEIILKSHLCNGG